MSRALVLSGAGCYTDPCHDFAATTRCLVGILADVGLEVEVAEVIPDRMANLDGVDVLVINAAAGPAGDAGTLVQGELDNYLCRGGGILAMHVGVCSLLDLTSWWAVTGARWVPGRTMHPPLGPCRVDVRPGDHAPGAPAESFDVVDERYCHLALAPGSAVVATHSHEGQVHPLVWLRTLGEARIVSDALGHGAESFDSRAHRELIARCARWVGHDLPSRA